SATFGDMTDFEDHFWSGKDIREIYKELEYADDLTGIEAIFVAGFGEYQRQMQISSSDTDAIINAIQRATRVAMTREELALEKHLGFLATLGSTAPYVGLFGTVIGIINSFRSLANMSQATLASVAPGISEALLATAIGLFAAIPAVIAFNRFSARVEVITKGYESFSDELISTLMNVVGTQRS
ncbi:MAG: MotA/TolQ/ExbB proton channel family protein, partial [Gammaproteobacteria bacterium]|nr:MotA/TolQ/ExbB proton channel family protein [Gammaproteobacteria bacterium]